MEINISELDKCNVQFHEEIKAFIMNPRIPTHLWSDIKIKALLETFSSMDSNNFTAVKCGMGEREGRIISPLVYQRNSGFGHGIGRSGDISSNQPKAVGSSILCHVTNEMISHYIQNRIFCISHKVKCQLFPLSVDECLALTLRKVNPSRCKPGTAFVSESMHSPLTSIINNVGMQSVPFTISQLISGNLSSCTNDNEMCFITSSQDQFTFNQKEKISQFCDSKHIPNIYINTSGFNNENISRILFRKSSVDVMICTLEDFCPDWRDQIGTSLLCSTNADFICNVCSSYAGRASIAASLDCLHNMLSMGISRNHNSLKQ